MGATRLSKDVRFVRCMPYVDHPIGVSLIGVSLIDASLIDVLLTGAIS